MMINSEKYIERTYYTMEDMGLTKSDIGELLRWDLSNATLDFVNVFYDHYKHNWAIYVDRVSDGITPIEEEPIPQSKIDDWKDKLSSAFRLTQHKYATIYTNTIGHSTDILNELKTRTVAKSNDTPQELDIDATDGYASNIVTNETSYDTQDLIVRIKRLHDNLDSILEEWVRSFDTLFGERI